MTSAALLIRAYRPEDWNAIARVHDSARMDELRSSVGVDAFLSLAETADSEGLFDGDLWVAEQVGTVLGFIAVDDVEVTWLYVAPAHYRRGIGRALLRHALAEAGPDMETTVLVGNQSALNLYLSEGFVIQETKAGKLEGNEAFAATGHIMRWRRPSG